MTSIDSPTFGPVDEELERRLKAAARRATKATLERDATICDAHREGAGLREIARAVQMSHSGVRRVLVRNNLIDQEAGDGPHLLGDTDPTIRIVAEYVRDPETGEMVDANEPERAGRKK